MNIDIRKHIINNFIDDDKETIKSAINESIEENDEVTLPGMGVFLEIIWKSSTDNEKDKLVTKITEYIKKEKGTSK